MSTAVQLMRPVTPKMRYFYAIRDRGHPLVKNDSKLFLEWKEKLVELSPFDTQHTAIAAAALGQESRLGGQQ